MTESTLGLFKGIEQFRNVLYFALWVQTRDIERKTVYRITVKRGNRGIAYIWSGPEFVMTDSELGGFRTGKPQTIVIGRTNLHSTTITEMARELNEGAVLQPHEFVVALLRELEGRQSYRSSIPELWSLYIQEWWDTQDIQIPTREEMERRRTLSGKKSTKSYSLLSQTVEEYPVTNGTVDMTKPKVWYDSRASPETGFEKDDVFQRMHKTPSSPQSSTQVSRNHPPNLTRATTLPILTKVPSRIQTRFARSVSPTERCGDRPNVYNHCGSLSRDVPDPHMRAFEARRHSSSAARNPHKSSAKKSESRPTIRPPRSKADRSRSETDADRKRLQVEVVKTVLKVLAATAMTVA